jgi:hypothetical protein
MTDQNPRNFLSQHGKRLVRVEARPNAADWGDDEALSLPEAARLFFPDGPLSEKSLRHAAAHGQLGFVRVAGKILTTAGAVRAMLRPPPPPDGRRS